MERVLLTTGGTGGHIFPALAVAEALRQRHPGVELLFVGAEGKMEMEKIPALGYRIEGLPVAIPGRGASPSSPCRCAAFWGVACGPLPLPGAWPVPSVGPGASFGASGPR